MIRRHGENVSSAAVGAVVAGDPAVAECAVLGVPDGLAGQAVALAVVPVAEGCEPAAVYDRLVDPLPRHAVPSYVHVVDDLPRTPTHKVRTAALRESLDLSTAWRRSVTRPPGRYVSRIRRRGAGPARSRRPLLGRAVAAP